MAKTCKHCGEDRKPGNFYHEAKKGELCAWCLIKYYRQIGVKQKVIDHIAYCNIIDLKEVS